MSKVIIDEKRIDTFLNRGVEKIYPSPEELKRKLLSGERIKVYQGFDPTGPYLHIGHAMGIRAMRILQELGHEIIFLIGDFTARVGDPDKEKGRKLLSTEEIKKNMEGWKKQAGQLIDFHGSNPVKFDHNYRWLSKLNLADLIDLMSQATVQQMLEREMFSKRIEKNDPIGIQEFIYPLMQGYDSVAMKVDLEIGGTDQTFNMLMGRHIVKKYLNKEKFVRTHLLMEAPDALTMSKTKGNGINLSDTPKDIYGKAMSYPDVLIFKAMRLLTDIPMDDIWQMEQEVEGGANPMKFKKVMAFEVVKIIRGQKDAEKAERYFEGTVQKKDTTDIKNAAELVEYKGRMKVLYFLKTCLGDQVSLGEIKRVLTQGGVSINNEKITDLEAEYNFESGTLIKFGKRRFFQVG
ncbi:tyrosine--tRNA ligase [Patescibacteria group bacterium]|nr:tyrosine--tRNA ligase [Patescibacteria group bacterium]